MTSSHLESSSEVQRLRDERDFARGAVLMLWISLKHSVHQFENDPHRYEDDQRDARDYGERWLREWGLLK